MVVLAYASFDLCLRAYEETFFAHVNFGDLLKNIIVINFFSFFFVCSNIDYDIFSDLFIVCISKL